MFIGSTDVAVETPILWPPDVKNWLIWKDPDSGKGWGQEKGMAEDEMVGWHYWLNGHGFGWTGSWWWTGNPGVLWFMGSQRAGHDWATELNWRRQKTYMQKSARHWWKMTQRDISCPWIGRISTVKLTILPEAISDSMQSLRLPMAFFIELGQKISQFVWKHKRKKAQPIREKAFWLGFIKTRNFCVVKDTIRRVKS